MSKAVGAVLVPGLLLAFVMPIASGSSSVPVLGWKGAFRSGTGFGSVKPRTVYLGGDPTGEVKAISWHQWGSARAVGFGRGWCPGQSVASGHPCPAALHVSGLGLCHGQRAYRMLAFYFKSGRKWTTGSRWNACTGA